MITCPNCNHQNPDGALQCEACYTPLPSLIACPSCGTPIQADASFCGQCGNDLRSLAAVNSEAATPVANSEMQTQAFAVPSTSAELAPDPDFALPDLIEPDPLIVPDPIDPAAVAEPTEPAAVVEPTEPATTEATEPATTEAAATPVIAPPVAAPATQLQMPNVRFRHTQTNTPIEIPRQLSVVRIGKPNDQTPPDIDVSGFPDSEVVSRVHANLRVEGDVYYLEDVGSSNGTYINGLPLPAGNRHRLRPGDRIAFGKGDKVSFIFETA